MRKLILFLMVFLCAVPAYADTITFDVPQSDIDVPLRFRNLEYFSSDFNGTPLNGQAISLDAILGGGNLGHLFLLSQPFFNLTIFTNAPSMVFPASSTYVMAPDGSPFGDVRNAIGGGGCSDCGFFGMGVVNFESVPKPVFVDIIGLHTEFTMPNMSEYEVTNARLRIEVRDNQLIINALPIPETSSVVMLVVGLALGGLAASVSYIASRPVRSVKERIRTCLL